MPKKSVTRSSGSAEAETGNDISTLSTWQVASLSMAVIVGHVFNGSGALVFGMLSVGVIWALHRLHTHAPQARTTAEMIASVPGAAPARGIVVIQYVAYVLLGAYAAKSIATMAVIWMSGPDTVIADWAAPVLAAAAVAVTAVIAGVLPSRQLAVVTAVAAGFSLLVFFYISLAVVARVASGTAPVTPEMMMGATPAPTEWGPVALLVTLALAFVAFEIPTTVNNRLGSIRGPLGGAMALVVACAMLAWLAANLATTGEFRYDAADLVMVVAQMYGDSGTGWLLAATVAQACAALLVLIWGATRVVGAPAVNGPLPLVGTAGAVLALAVVVTFGWGDIGVKLWGVAGLLLLVVYLAAAQAYSRIDDSNTSAWALFALMGLVLGVTVFLKGVSDGWWPAAIAAVVVGVAAVWARQSGKPNSRTTP